MNALILSTVFLAVAFGAEKITYRDEDLKKKDAPAFLQKATPNESGVKDIEYFKKTYSDGKTTFELKYEKNDEEISETWSSDGKLIEKEEDIQFKMLPDSLQRKITSYFKEKYKNFKILETEKRTTQDGKKLIDVEISHKNGSGVTEISFTE